MKRPLLWGGAVTCLIAALVLVMGGGLPDRAAYSGYLLASGQAVAPEIGAFAPPFQESTLDGTVSLRQMRGAPVVINFWATWCIPCRVEMPELQAFHQAHPQVQVIAVDLGEPRDLVVDWVTQFGITFPIALDGDSSTAALYRLRGQPSTYVVSPGGVITHIFFGPTNRQSLEAALEPFLRTS